jgi:hypothetical protein
MRRSWRSPGRGIDLAEPEPLARRVREIGSATGAQTIGPVVVGGRRPISGRLCLPRLCACVVGDPDGCVPRALVRSCLACFNALCVWGKPRGAVEHAPAVRRPATRAFVCLSGCEQPPARNDAADGVVPCVGTPAAADAAEFESGRCTKTGVCVQTKSLARRGGFGRSLACAYNQVSGNMCATPRVVRTPPRKGDL